MSRCMEEVDAHIRVMETDVGLIVGQQMSTLRQLRRKHLVDIILPKRSTNKQARAQQQNQDSDANDSPQAPSADVTVRGIYSDVFQAIEEIHALVPQGVGSTTVNFLFPTYKLGVIIGKGGQTITKIKKETKGFLIIDIEDGNPEITLYGTRLSVRNAYETILGVVQTFENKREDYLVNLPEHPNEPVMNHSEPPQQKEEEEETNEQSTNIQVDTNQRGKYRGGRGRGKRGFRGGRGFNRGRGSFQQREPSNEQ